MHFAIHLKKLICPKNHALDFHQNGILMYCKIQVSALYSEEHKSILSVNEHVYKIELKRVFISHERIQNAPP